MSEKTLLILGVAGVSLAMAMFFDSSYPVEPPRHPQEPHNAPVHPHVPHPVHAPNRPQTVHHPQPPPFPPAPEVIHNPPRQDPQEVGGHAIEEIMAEVSGGEEGEEGEEEVQAPPPPPSKTKYSGRPKVSRSGGYRDLYLKKKAKERKKREAKLIREINGNAYTGDWSESSKRQYLHRQAYKRSREATPIIPLESVMQFRHSEPEAEGDEDTITDEYDDLEGLAEAAEVVDAMDGDEAEGAGEPEGPEGGEQPVVGRAPPPAEKKCVTITSEAWNTQDPIGTFT